MAECKCEYVHGDNPYCPVHNDLCPTCEGRRDEPWVRVRDNRYICAHFTEEQVHKWQAIITEPYAHYLCPDPFHSGQDELDRRAAEMIEDRTSLANRIAERIPSPHESDERAGYWREPLRKNIARALALIEIENGGQIR